MNKAKVIEMMAEATRLPKSTCKECLEAFTSIVSTALKQKKQVSLTGFGTFLTMERKERIGINPVTRKKMTIPAKTVPKFKPSKVLKDMVA